VAICANSKTFGFLPLIAFAATGRNHGWQRRFDRAFSRPAADPFKTPFQGDCNAIG
jgi:hypothetical protein